MAKAWGEAGHERLNEVGSRSMQLGSLTLKALHGPGTPECALRQKAQQRKHQACDLHVTCMPRPVARSSGNHSTKSKFRCCTVRFLSNASERSRSDCFTVWDPGAFNSSETSVPGVWGSF